MFLVGSLPRYPAVTVGLLPYQDPGLVKSEPVPWLPSFGVLESWRVFCESRAWPSDHGTDRGTRRSVEQKGKHAAPVLMAYIDTQHETVPRRKRLMRVVAFQLPVDGFNLRLRWPTACWITQCIMCRLTGLSLDLFSSKSRLSIRAGTELIEKSGCWI